VKLHLRSIEEGMERFAVSIAAETHGQHNRSWPFVTVPAFEALGDSVRAQTGMEIILLCPLVQEAQVQTWQEYSVEMAPTWLAESRAISLSASARAASSGRQSTLVATDYIKGGATPKLLDLVSGVSDVSAGANLEFVPSIENSGPYYFPVWMQTPPPLSPQLININFLSTGSTVKPLLSAVMATRRPLLSLVFDITSLSRLNVKFEDHELYHASLVKYLSNATSSAFQHPHAPYLHPVYVNDHDQNSDLAAILVAILPFDRYLINLLPQGVVGIDMILRNGEQNFTYHLEGNSVCSMCLNPTDNHCGSSISSHHLPCLHP
jgi:hypothetical protein